MNCGFIWEVVQCRNLLGVEDYRPFSLSFWPDQGLAQTQGSRGGWRLRPEICLEGWENSPMDLRWGLGRYGCSPRFIRKNMAHLLRHACWPWLWCFLTRIIDNKCFSRLSCCDSNQNVLLERNQLFKKLKTFFSYLKAWSWTSRTCMQTEELYDFLEPTQQIQLSVASIKIQVVHTTF